MGKTIYIKIIYAFVACMCNNISTDQHVWHIDGLQILISTSFDIIFILLDKMNLVLTD